MLLKGFCRSRGSFGNVTAAAVFGRLSCGGDASDSADTLLADFVFESLETSITMFPSSIDDGIAIVHSG